MTDRLELRGLRLVASIGLLPEERERPQPIELDIDLDLTTAAGSTDDLADTVDYGAVCDRVAELVGAGHVDLLERLAAMVAEDLVAKEAVSRAEVLVRKLRPPVPHDLATAAVRVERIS